MSFPGLRIGITVASDHCSGNTSSRKIRFNKFFRYMIPVSGKLFRRILGTWSGPGLEFLVIFRDSTTSSYVIGLFIGDISLSLVIWVGFIFFWDCSTLLLNALNFTSNFSSLELFAKVSASLFAISWWSLMTLLSIFSAVILVGFFITLNLLYCLPDDCGWGVNI